MLPESLRHRLPVLSSFAESTTTTIRKVSDRLLDRVVFIGGGHIEIDYDAFLALSRSMK